MFELWCFRTDTLTPDFVFLLGVSFTKREKKNRKTLRGFFFLFVFVPGSQSNVITLLFNVWFQIKISHFCTVMGVCADRMSALAVPYLKKTSDAVIY